jgi:hypothetical protein
VTVGHGEFSKGQPAWLREVARRPAHRFHPKERAQGSHAPDHQLVERCGDDKGRQDDDRHLDLEGGLPLHHKEGHHVVDILTMQIIAQISVVVKIRIGYRNWVWDMIGSLGGSRLCANYRRVGLALSSPQHVALSMATRSATKVM